METWELIILVIVGALALLAIGGALARQRLMVAGRGRFDTNLQRVNEELAAAHAQDRGWERAGLEAAARDAFAAQRPGAKPDAITLVQVIDRPGTDEDKAVFRFDAGPERVHVTLGRSGGEWVFEHME